MTTKFSNADASESLVLTFDFAQGLDGAETLDTPTAVVEVDYGVDPNAANIVAAAQVVGETVLVAVQDLVSDTDYRITVTCTTSDSQKTMVLAGILPVRRA